MENTKKVPVLRFSDFSGDWQVKKISQILEAVSKKVDVEENELYNQIGIRSHGKGIFYKEPVSGKILGKKRVFWIKENVFIVNIVFAWEHAVAKTTENELGMIASHRFPMYQPLNNLCSIDYILCFFLTKKGKSFLELASPGGAGRNKTLGQNEFKKLKIIIPSVQEQQKIADFLSQIDNRIKKLTKKKQLLEKYKKGIMQDIFSQKIRFKDDNRNNYPEWEAESLEDIGEFKNGLNKSKEDFGFGFPFVNLMDVFGKNSVSTNNLGLVNVTDKELKLYNLKKGDVLFIRSSVKLEGIGETSVVINDLNNTVYSGFLIRFRERDGIKKLNLYFKKYCFNTHIFRNSLLSVSTTSANTNINQESLKLLEIDIPSFPEQEKIANFITAIDDKIALVEKQLNGTKQYKQGLLQKMFV